MPFGMKRADLRAISEAKLMDAAILLQNGRASNSYYLAGYSVEIGLKACVAAQLSAETIPDKSFLREVYTHHYPTLISVAGLKANLREKEDQDSQFAANWAISSEWTPDSRYQATDMMLAQLMHQAISDPQSGVLTWIKHYW